MTPTPPSSSGKTPLPLSDTQTILQPPSARLQSRNPAGTGFIVLPEPELEELERLLDELIAKAPARCGLVLDRTGMILSNSGDFHPITPQVMGATAAGIIAALNTMVARAASQEIHVRFYGSDVDRIHFLLLGERMILCLLLSRGTNSTSVRNAVRQFASRMSPLLERYRPDKKQGEELMKSVKFIESKLDSLFKDKG
ncbi:MAG: hypothetical protein SF028_10255 [Candidatus Sumerlaeia bacterium]|nr:hypothetical protein [Candidatus Sumerlaeia bacterium]